MSKLNKMKKVLLFVSITVLIIAAIVIISIYSKSKNDKHQEADNKEITPTVTPIVTQEAASTNPNPKEKSVINVYTSDRNLVSILKVFQQQHPDFGLKIEAYDDGMVFSSTDIMNFANKALANGDASEMDMYSVIFSASKNYIKGDSSKLACPYKELGIDVDAELKNADIPQYAIDNGTNQDGEIIALPYASSPVVFMYRRSIAKKVWGTDDPDKIAEILGAGTESYDKFLEAAQTLKKKGYYTLTGSDDFWPLFDTSTSIDTNGKINPEWEQFMDLSKLMYDRGYMKDIGGWTDDWFKYLDGLGDKPVFGQFTVPDMPSYISSKGNSYGLKSTIEDWAICQPPVSILSGEYTTGIMVNKFTPNKEKIGQIIKWLTLDTSKNGYQYYRSTQDKMAVLSGTVLNNTECKPALLYGQNMNPLINKLIHAPSKIHGAFNPDYMYSIFWTDQVNAYLQGEKDRKTAIEDFKEQVKSNPIQ